MRGSSPLALAPLVVALTLLAPLACSRPSPTGVSLDRSIREPSGVTMSPTYPGVLWTHGDSGSGNWLFATDLQGRVLTRLRVRGAMNLDWEDITHDDLGNLWIGDIGNNNSSRRDLVVHRLREPDPHAELERVRVDFSVGYHFEEQTRFGDKFEDFDAEALFWWGERLWLLTKHRSDDLTWLYRFPPLSEEQRRSEVALERVASFDLSAQLEHGSKGVSGMVTAAEVAADGRHWAMLSYDAVFVFEIPESGEGAELFAEQRSRVEFDRRHTRQVEALTWDGDALLLINEDRTVFRIEDPLTRARYP